MFEYRPFVDQFLDYCCYHKKLSDKTVRAYKIDLSQYVLFSDTLSKQALWDYIECLNKKYKPKTVKRKLATLKAFIHFLLLQDYIEFNPFDKLETSIREPVLLPKTIPLDVIAKIISFSYQQIGSAQSAYQMKCAVRNAAVIELLFATGARIAEICTLKPENVDLLGRSVKFYGKGSKERLIPVENMAVLSILNLKNLLTKIIGQVISLAGSIFSVLRTLKEIRNKLSNGLQSPQTMATSMHRLFWTKYQSLRMICLRIRFLVCLLVLVGVFRIVMTTIVKTYKA